MKAVAFFNISSILLNSNGFPSSPTVSVVIRTFGEAHKKEYAKYATLINMTIPIKNNAVKRQTAWIKRFPYLLFFIRI